MSNRSKDRSSLCAFTFADARQCRTPRRAGHPYLCAFHARKEAQALAGEAAGQDIAYHLSGSYVSACDLSSALGRLFSAVAQGQVRISRLRIAQNSLLTNLFRINTCKSVSKQSTLTTFRINTCEKHRGRGGTFPGVQTGHIPDRIDREHPRHRNCPS